MFTVEVQFSALFSVTRCNLPLLALPGKLQGQQVLRCLAEGNEEVGCTVFCGNELFTLVYWEIVKVLLVQFCFIWLTLWTFVDGQITSSN